MESDLNRAAVFFVLNRSSFSGITLSGGMSPGHPRFTESAIQRLREFRAPNLSVACADFNDTLSRFPDDFLYLDPPYANGERLYGMKGDMHNGFDHEGLAESLRNRTGWILSYNDHPDIRKMYSGFDLHTPDWQYGMSNQGLPLTASFFLILVVLGNFLRNVLIFVFLCCFSCQKQAISSHVFGL